MRHILAHFFVFIYFCAENGYNVQLKLLNMKKITLAIMALLAFSFTLEAQQFVSTEPSNRNVILEEFTGRLCGYCPDGHVRLKPIILIGFGQLTSTRRGLAIFPQIPIRI